MAYQLSENPFFLLDLSPRVDVETIINRAADLELLYGIDVQEAKNQLLHPAGRLAAEISYLPAASDGEIKTIYEYLKKESPGSIPEISLESSLALFNAAAAFLLNWPLEDLTGAQAVCLALTGIASQIKTDRILEEINRDREAGGYEPVKDSFIILEEYRKHVSEIFSDLADRCMKLPPDQLNRLRMLLALEYQSGREEYRHAQVLSELVCKHLAHGSLAAKQAEEKIILTLIDQYREEKKALSERKESTNPMDILKPGRGPSRNYQLDQILTSLEAWNQLSIPERTIAKAGGFTDPEAEKLFDALNKFMVDMVNNWADRSSGSELIRKLLDVFTDIPLNKRKLLEENSKILL